MPILRFSKLIGAFKSPGSEKSESAVSVSVNTMLMLFANYAEHLVFTALGDAEALPSFFTSCFAED